LTGVEMKRGIVSKGIQTGARQEREGRNKSVHEERVCGSLKGKVRAGTDPIEGPMQIGKGPLLFSSLE